jgi:guanylate kinase
VLDVRGDLQAVDLNDAERTLAAGDLFFEGNPFVGRKLLEVFAPKVSVLSIFLSPLSHEEIVFLRSQARSLSLENFLTDVMRRKLLRRTQRQKNILSLKDLENIERLAASAYTELKEAWNFEHIIPNHDGEDSENWDAFYYPVGDARKALLAFADLVGGKGSPLVEKWEEDLLS